MKCEKGYPTKTRAWLNALGKVIVKCGVEDVDEAYKHQQIVDRSVTIDQYVSKS